MHLGGIPGFHSGTDKFHALIDRTQDLIDRTLHHASHFLGAQFLNVMEDEKKPVTPFERPPEGQH